MRDRLFPPMKKLQFLTFFIFAAAVCGRAQSVKVVDAGVPLSPPLTPVSPVNASGAVTTQAVQATIPLQWNESSVSVTVNYRNEGQTLLQIQGIKTTAGFFIVDYRHAIALGNSIAIE